MAQVQTSAKYQAVAPGLVRDLAARELAKARSPKEAVKAVKNKLHQVAGAYLDAKPDYPAWLSQLEQAHQTGADLRPLCQEFMRRHASTRERLPILAEFYQAIFAGLAPVGAVLDLACGLNPLALPWMALAPTTRYVACDIWRDEVTFLDQWLRLLGQPGAAFVHDLLTGPPQVQADVVLLLKAIPCLEQMDKTLGARLLAAIDAPVVVVSFPAASLGGSAKGMTAHYTSHFQQLVDPDLWQVERLEFETELVFRLRRK